MEEVLRSKIWKSVSKKGNKNYDYYRTAVPKTLVKDEESRELIWYRTQTNGEVFFVVKLC